MPTIEERTLETLERLVTPADTPIARRFRQVYLGPMAGGIAEAVRSGWPISGLVPVVDAVDRTQGALGPAEAETWAACKARLKELLAEWEVCRTVAYDTGEADEWLA